MSVSVEESLFQDRCDGGETLALESAHQAQELFAT